MDRMGHRSALRRGAGFTTLELMVAGSIFLIVAVHVLGTFSNQMKSYNTQKRVGDVQQDARLAAEMILRDIRTAGFMLPTVAGMASADGGNGAADRLCTSDAGFFSDITLDAAMDRFDGASPTADVGAGAGSVALSTLDLDSDTNNDFTVDRGLIISDGTRSHCARVTGIAGSTVSYTPATPGGFSVTAAAGTVVPAVVYEINGQGLERNTLLVSQQVEDLQFEFAVDNDGDGAIGVGEFPINDLTGSDLSEIGGVQLYVLTRSESPDPDFSGPGRQALANRTAGAADAFRRRLVSVTAAPRNL
jgi:Tfp pilus assembly protein PilW